MREVVIDLRGMYERLSALPDRLTTDHHKPWKNDEDWILWSMWPRKRQNDTAKAIGRCVGSCRERFEELKKQGGPKGERPEWMK